jgi:thiol-disulfide isomerase/thioredoxin
MPERGNEMPVRRIWAVAAGTLAVVFLCEGDPAGASDFGLRMAVLNPQSSIHNPQWPSAAVASSVRAAGSPVPYDGAANVDPVDLTLSWPPVAGAQSYRVYFGADSTDPPLLQTTTKPSLKVAALVVPGRCYYWRVHTSLADQTAIAGPLWRFTIRSPTPPDPNLLAWYAFDEAAGAASRDLSGHGSETRLTQMTWSTTGAPGFDGGSVVSDGSGNVQFSIPGTPLPFDGLTLTGWFQVRQQNESAVLWCLGSGPDSCVSLLSDAANGSALVVDAVETSRKEHVISPAPDPLQTERWTHLAVTMNASTLEVVVHQDGATVLTARGVTCLPAVLEQAVQVSVAASLVPDLGLVGALDDIRLYARVLGPDELARTMLGHPDSPYGPDPLCWAQRHISVPAVLRWQGTDGAAGYDVYTGSDPANMRMVWRALDTPEYTLEEPLADGQTLYWLVESLREDGFVRGPLWQFSVTQESLDDVIAARGQGWRTDYPSYYGRVAPDISLTDVNGRGHRLRDYRGRHLLVVLWAPWCPACRTEMSHLSELRTTVGEDELALLAITDTTNADTLPAFLAEHREITFPVALKRISALPAPFGTIDYIPSGFYIAPDGTIKLGTVGAVGPEEIQAILRAAWRYQP